FIRVLVVEFSLLARGEFAQDVAVLLRKPVLHILFLLHGALGDGSRALNGGFGHETETTLILLGLKNDRLRTELAFDVVERLLKCRGFEFLNLHMLTSPFQKLLHSRFEE